MSGLLTFVGFHPTKPFENLNQDAINKEPAFVLLISRTSAGEVGVVRLFHDLLEEVINKEKSEFAIAHIVLFS